MRARRSIALGFVLLVGSGCGANKLKESARDEYCNALESSPVKVDNPLDSVASSLRALQMIHGSMQTFMDRGEDTRELLWRMAGACETIASGWSQAVGNTSALNSDWWSVRQVTGALVIDPPTALSDSKELHQACVPDDLHAGAPPDAATLRTATAHGHAALEELKSEKARWVRERDSALAKCEASGWQRRHEPGYWLNPKR